MPSIAAFADELQALVDLYIAEMPERIEELRRALSSSDRVQLRRLAHRLKGSAGQYGFPDISAQAAALERLVCENADSSTIHDSALQLIAQCDERAQLCIAAREDKA